jgi:chemosensory pili system protein ChpB (putative protein-glutamate methylesterase)
MAATEAAPRVALLARAGEACERIAGALRDAGAELVLVADPMQAGPDQVRQAQPQAVLVALEPAIEDAVERFADVLADPAYMVIFEEAEQAAQRSGWDAARWLRHLSAKLHRHSDVLPAGAETGDDLQLTAEPLAPRARAVDFDDTIATLTGEARQCADDVPPDGLEGLVAFAPEGEGAGLELAGEWSQAEESGALLELSLEGIDVEAALGADDSAAAAGMPQDAREDEPAPGMLALSLDDGDGLELSFDPERFGRAGEAMDAAAGIDEFLAAQAADAATGSGDSVAAPAGERSDPPPTWSTTGLDFSGLSLVDDDHVPATAPASDKPGPAFDLDALGSGLSLVDPDSYGHGNPPGLVLIEAGLGGPDAVRQLLASLPAGFPKAILIRLPLDGGRYDRLVKQMMRATAAPVSVAEAGQQVVAGSIHFVPPGLGLRAAGAGWVFDAGQTLDAAALLPAGDSAIVFLSGADSALVPLVAGGSWNGLVLGQTPDDGCYDPAAARAAIEAGAAHGSPAELAERLCDRWPAPGDRPPPDLNGMQ